eukprot:511532-Pyramimonas_sp.AAC.1
MDALKFGTRKAEFLSAVSERLTATENEWIPYMMRPNPDRAFEFLEETTVACGKELFQCGAISQQCQEDAVRRRRLFAERCRLRELISS